jgi:excinuclease ABC subunit C
MPATEHIRKKLSELPHKPGIYLMKDRFGTVIYVGKARDLRKRVSQYFHPSRRMGWDLKLNALVDAIHDFDVHVVKNEPESLLLEGKLIKEFHPRYNVSFRDDKRFLLLKVNLNDPIPRFTLTRLKTDDGARYFGPFAHSGALRSTLTIANNRYKAGLVTYLEVATAQSSALALERTVTQLRGQKLVASVGLIRAIGGGWQASEPLENASR